MSPAGCLHEDDCDCFARAAERQAKCLHRFCRDCGAELSTLRERLAEAEKERDRWKGAKEHDAAENAVTREVLATERAARVQAEAALSRSVELIRRRHGMECPTYDEATATCGGCEVSAFLAEVGQ